MIRTLRGRLFLSTLAAALLCVGVALAIGIVLTRSALEDSIKAGITHEAKQVAYQLSLVPTGTRLPTTVGEPPTGQDQAQPPPPAGGPPRGAPPQARPVQPQQQPPQARPSPRGRSDRPQVVRNSRAGTVLPPAQAASVRSGQAVSGTTTVQGSKEIYAAQPIKGRDAFVLVTRPAAITSGDFNKYLTGLLVAAAVAALLAAIVAALLARAVDRPIKRVVDASQVVAAGRSPEPLPPEKTAELSALVDSFNAMSAQLARAREAERAVLLSTSHELRTPLTAIRGYAEGIEDGAMDAREGAVVIGREAGRLERLVADLLALARIDQGVLEVKREPVDLEVIANEARQRLAAQAGEGNVEVIVTADGATAALADQGRVLQVVSNLVDNAIRMTPAGGRVTIEVGSGKVAVTDNGPGIPADELAQTFERFHLRRRVGAASGEGSGLGLAIVRELTEAMGGSVSVANVPSGGSRFDIALPT